MKLAQWVDEVKAIGGVPDTCPDTLAAMRAASTLCWAEIDRKGQSRSELAQLGIAWTAAFMVSCARHGATDFCSILVPSNHRQETFRREAARNYGVLAKILGEAADASPGLLDAALLAAGAHWTIAPSGRGKGVGG